MKFRPLSVKIIITSLFVTLMSVFGILYNKLDLAKNEVLWAKASEKRAKQALLNERISRYMECSGPICADRWPDAAEAVKKAQAEVDADKVAKAAKNKE